jgi:hypothetical protein
MKYLIASAGGQVIEVVTLGDASHRIVLDEHPIARGTPCNEHHQQ